ncbi:MAG: nucleotide exchange factor GrpE [Synergistaceae bacterium]|jgi:molecular chaperone GrpE (heat shock protein)|nr:nucleotide exchange factor GrpE [Synergistaceae bacterium]
MFGLFKKTEEMQAELRQSVVSDVLSNLSNLERVIEESSASVNSSNASLAERLVGLEEQIQQTQRQERRRQMAIESLLENQGKIMETQKRLETPPPLEAITALADNLALVCLSKSEDPVYSILYGKLTELLACYGLSLVADVGNDFDPDRHEACAARRNSTRPENTVLEVVRPGFLSKGKVLRYATVVVNRYDAEPEVEAPTRVNLPPLHRNGDASWEGKLYD